MRCDGRRVCICFRWEDPGKECTDALAHMCVHGPVRKCTRPRTGSRPGEELRIAGPAPSHPDPLSPPPLVTPSLIAAQHTEAICSTEACRHGDAGRLYGFAGNWPTGK